MKLKLVLGKWQSNICSPHIFYVLILSWSSASFISCTNIMNNDDNVQIYCFFSLQGQLVTHNMARIYPGGPLLDGIFSLAEFCLINWLPVEFLAEKAQFVKGRVFVLVTQGPTHWNIRVWMTLWSLIWEQLHLCVSLLSHRGRHLRFNHYVFVNGISPE